MMFSYRRNRGFGFKPSSGTLTCFGDSLSDPQVSVNGIFQGAWGGLLTSRYGWARAGAGGAMSGATVGVPVASGGHVTGVPVTGFGHGYGVAPAVTITGGTFTVQATAHAVLGSDGQVAVIVIDNAGTYSVAPTGATIASPATANAGVAWIPFFSGGGTNASFTSAAVSGGALTGVLNGVVGAGGYPTWGASLTFSGGGATTQGFADNCTTNGAGALTSPMVTTAGSFSAGAGYTGNPAVAVSNSNDWARAAIASTTLIHSAALAANACGIDSYQTRVVNANCDVVTVWYGTNDYTQCNLDAGTGFATFNPLAFYTALSTVVAAIKATSSDPLVVLLGMGPLANRLGTNPASGSLWSAATFPTGMAGQALTSGAAVLAEFDAAIQRVAWERHCVYAPMDGLNLVTMGATAGNIHLNSLGAAFVADRIGEAIGGA